MRRVAVSSSRPPMRHRWRFPRSVGPCSVVVGPCYTPDVLCVNGASLKNGSPPTSCPFWAWPITPVGQSTLTTLQPHVRLPNPDDFARGPPIVTFDLVPRSTHRLPEVDDQSRSVGSCCSSVHDEGWVSHPSMNQQLSPCQRQSAAVARPPGPVPLPTGRTLVQMPAIEDLHGLRRSSGDAARIL